MASAMRRWASSVVGQPGKLRQPLAAGATGRVQIADHHVVEEDVVQPAGAEMPAHEVRMDIEHRQLGQRLFQISSPDS